MYLCNTFFFQNREGFFVVVVALLMPLLSQDDISHYNNIENETETAKKGLSSYLRCEPWFSIEYLNLRTLILCDIYGTHKSILAHTCMHSRFLINESGSFTLNSSVSSSARSPGPLMLLRNLWGLIQLSSKAYCWQYLVQVPRKEKNPSVQLHYNSVSVHPQSGHLDLLLQATWHTSWQPACWTSRGPPRSWFWRFWLWWSHSMSWWRSTKEKASAAVSDRLGSASSRTYGGWNGEWELFIFIYFLEAQLPVPQPGNPLGGWFCVCRVFIVVVLGLFITWLAVDTRKRPEQLISFGGVCMFVLLLFLFSAHRMAVSFSVGWVRGVAMAPAISKHAETLSPHVISGWFCWLLDVCNCVPVIFKVIFGICRIASWLFRVLWRL